MNIDLSHLTLNRLFVFHCIDKEQRTAPIIVEDELICFLFVSSLQTDSFLMYFFSGAIHLLDLFRFQVHVNKISKFFLSLI